MNSRDVNKQSWNRQADRYQRGAAFSFDSVDYGIMNMKTEKDLHLVGDVTGKKVLDLGCGGGNNSIALAKQGAAVTGVDISEEQIRHARENAKREGVEAEFVVSSMEDFDTGREQYDVVISMAAMGYIEDIGAVFQKIARALKPQGILVCSLPHAASTCFSAKYVYNDPPECHSYFYTGPTKWKWEDDDDFEFYGYCRPVSGYINLMIESGLAIQCVHELQELHENIDGKETETHAMYPDMLVIKAKKA